MFTPTETAPLVERLRTDVLWHQRRGNDTIAKDCQEAADEIDRLYKLLAEQDAAIRALQSDLAAEREACAAICRTQAARWADDRARYAAHECASAIESAAPYRAGA